MKDQTSPKKEDLPKKASSTGTDDQLNADQTNLTADSHDVSTGEGQITGTLSPRDGGTCSVITDGVTIDGNGTSTAPIASLIPALTTLTVSGTQNGVNTVFTLSPAPNPSSSLQFLVNGIEQEQGVAYTLSGTNDTTLTFASYAPASTDWLSARAGAGTIVAPSAGVQVQSTESSGFRKVYSKTPWTSTPYNKITAPFGNLITSNSDFSDGATGWTINYLTAEDPTLYRFTTAGGMTVLQLDETTDVTGHYQGSFSIVIPIPPELQYSVLEISVAVSGFFDNFEINNEDFPNMSIQIDPDHPMRIYYYFQPNGATTVRVRLYRCVYTHFATGLFVNYGQVLVKAATYTLADVSKNLPSTGSNIQIANWVQSGAWNEPFQQQLIATYRKLGGICRIWLSCEIFADYTTTTATKRTTVPSGDFTTTYAALTTEYIPTGALDSSMTYYLDWFFNMTRQYGLKLHICLAGGFTDGNGNPSATKSKQGAIEFLDSDPAMQSGFISLFETVVTRYLDYENIIGWEFINESYPTWSESYAGLKISGVLAQDRAQMYYGYAVFERGAYAAIKAIDPNRPVILNSASTPVAQYFVQPNNCDWFCPSFYFGYLTLSQSNVSTVDNQTIMPSNGYQQLFETTQNGQVLYAVASSGYTLPMGLAINTPYYIINVNPSASTIQLSDSLGGDAITLTGGTGTFYLYSEDGTSLSFADYVLTKYAFEPKYTYHSEFAAPAFLYPYLFLTDTINAAYIQQFIPRLQKYGIASFMTWDEPGLMFNTSTFAFLNGGNAILTAGISSFAQDATSNTALTDTQTFTGQTTFTGNIYVTDAVIAHLVGGTLTPTIVPGTCAGTSPTISIRGSDLCFTVTLVVGASPASGGQLFVVTFNAPFPSGVVPQVVMTPGNITAAQLSGTGTPYVNYGVTTNTTVVVSIGSTALTATDTYIWTLAVFQ